ncbi:Ppx/GppA family phosphatase [Amylibacter sp. SFDW26]|uniref:Ppx/GppA phosphatase family protein n=1 Tax=Amylibacter sp. SFDW26 TaxID=2652722 RepID=UPI0012629083|nr:Ppx/GppA phosphatase family protein [Amylibacter sp. SFDW26]KAB7613675.1 Ppx/GppA family phosphatase [Amylibacter sp. SFDW26]
MNTTEPDKTAVIDVGSNSVRLVVYYGAKRAPLQFFNEKVSCGLGRGLADSGILNPEGRKRALAAIERFVGIAERMGVKQIHTVATAAVRDASDGQAFCDDVLLATNISLRVVSGHEEAALSAQGVFFCRPEAQALVCDMGGSSMELAKIGGGDIELARTSELGPLHLQKFETDEKTLKAEIKMQLKGLAIGIEGPHQLYLIGGTIRSLAALDMARKDYPLSVINEYTLNAKDFKEFLKWTLKQSREEIEAYGAVNLDRLDYVHLVAQVMLGVLKALDIEKVTFSSFGIREGVLYEKMPPRVQRRDPLIEACQYFERTDARFPEFGTTLYAWVLTLFTNVDEDRKRLIWAACLLHDVNWRAHPDYRGEVSFDYVARGNLLGLSHQECIFLAVALIHRYRNKPKAKKLAELNEMLAPEDRVQAEIAGRAMRLGAMLGGPDVAHMGKLKLGKGKLILGIDQESEGLVGEVVERRLGSLAATMELTPEMRIE